MQGLGVCAQSEEIFYEISIAFLLQKRFHPHCVCVGATGPEKRVL